MLRLTGLLTLLIVSMTGLIVTVRTIGNAQTTYNGQLLRATQINPDGSPCKVPCMFGIQLGITKFDDSVKLLQSHPFLHIVSVDLSEAKSRYPYIKLSLSNDMSIHIYGKEDASIGLITLSLGKPTESKLTLGDVITIFDSPNSIINVKSFAPKNAATEIFYPQDILIATGDPIPRLSLYTPVIAIELISDFSAYMYTTPKEWRGFKNYPPVIIGN